MHSHPADIKIEDYTYHLPNDRIAYAPVEQRDQAKQLIYKNGAIVSDTFSSMANHLPAACAMVLNDTKVIHARLQFVKDTGAVIEIFCLEPIDALDLSQVMSSTLHSKWKCLVGGASKWKSGPLNMKVVVHNEEVIISAYNLGREEDAYNIEFSWNNSSVTFADWIEVAGAVPLPPYIKRKAAVEDDITYQTVYALHQGSVAAPTAGLHFTNDVLQSLRLKNIDLLYLTLHVGAGTFKPVKATTLSGHIMHHEIIVIKRSLLLSLLNHSFITAVGTTSLRTLESIYWIGSKLLLHKSNAALQIEQWDVYDQLAPCRFSRHEAIQAILQYMDEVGKNELVTKTQLLIVPGYLFRMVDALVTNFHQPGSTLLLLVAAAIGDDWKKVYQFAMDNQYRFLSYGDSSLLFLPENKIFKAE